MKKHHSIIILLLLLLQPLWLKAQMDEDIRHHIIVAADMAGCEGWIDKEMVPYYIIQLLKSTNYEDSGDRKLYETEDYISFLGFRIEPDKRDMSTYQLPMTQNNKGIIWRKHFPVDSLSEIWSSLVQSRGGNANSFSLVSVAKTYALQALKAKTPLTNRTFIIMITDHQYNSNDFYEELQSLKWRGSRLEKDSIFKKSYDVEREYFIRYLKTIELPYLSHNYRKTYMEFYEYVPMHRTLALSSVIDYPPMLTAHRLSDGNYEVKVPIAERNNPNFKLLKLDVFPDLGHKYESPAGCASITTASDTICLKVDGEKRPKAIVLRAWLHVLDGVYDATVLSPSRSSTIYAGRDGLNIEIPLEYEPTATIVGVDMPACFLTICSDQYLLAGILTILFWTILLGCALFWLIRKIRKSQTYRPRLNDFIINLK